MHRSTVSVFLATAIGLVSGTQTFGQSVCKPAVKITDVQFSGMEPPTLERTWSAVVLGDSSACAEGSAGKFEIIFLQSNDHGPPVQFAERFTWLHSPVQVEVKFLGAEAADTYKIG